ncbi:MAG: hypothetical protein AAGU05_09120, partial [Anaerolineaceae bacterium]
WEPELSDYVVDAERIFNDNLSIIVSSIHESEQRGTYLIDLFGEQKKLSDRIYYRLEMINGNHPALLAWDYDTVDLISPTGEVIQIRDRGSYYEFSYVSPDQNWFILGMSGMFDLFSNTGQFIRQLNSLDAYSLIWNPDSKSLMVPDQDGLYYLSIPDGEPVLVETFGSYKCYCTNAYDYLWIP